MHSWAVWSSWHMNKDSWLWNTGRKTLILTESCIPRTSTLEEQWSEIYSASDSIQIKFLRFTIASSPIFPASRCQSFLQVLCQHNAFQSFSSTSKGDGWFKFFARVGKWLNSWHNTSWHAALAYYHMQQKPNDYQCNGVTWQIITSHIPIDEAFFVQSYKCLSHCLWSFVIHCKTLQTV